MQIITNTLGQRVQIVEWNELLSKALRKKPFTGKEDLNGKTLVVRHTWGIGDVLYSTAAMKALKEKFPECKIIYVCTYPDVLLGNPDIDKVHHWAEFDEDFGVPEEEQKDWYFLDYDTPLKGGFDYKVNLRPKFQLNEHLLSLLKMDPKTLIKQDKEFVGQASKSVVNRYKMVALDMYCSHAYTNPIVKSVYYYPTQEELTWARTFLDKLRDAGKRTIILLPHTSTRFKDYPHWKQVIKLLPMNYAWIIMGSSVIGERWSTENVFDCTRAFQLRQSFALCIEADLVCCSDTGLVYPRLALGKPAVMTYGPHDPAPFLHYFQPQAHGMRIDKLKLDHGSVKAGQCSCGCYIDSVQCSNGDYSPCLQELEPERVANEIKGILE